MPRKACCCNVVPPETGSCCRPIYNGCIGKEYEFSFQFSAKYPCMNLNGNPATFECQNNSVLLNIPGNFETYEITCRYTIEKPAELRASPACIGPGNSNLTSNCGNWGCQGSGFNPIVPSTWKYCSNLIFSCLKCNCYTNSNYSYCNFDAGKLKTSCNCDTGFIPFIYNCTTSGINVSEIDGTNPAPCGEDGFGNIRPFTLIQTGNSKLLDLWSACYRFYELKQNDFGFSNFGPCGCTFEPGSKNLLDSYTVQFIPDPNIPEQLNPNYEPKLRIDLINFSFQCSVDGTIEYSSLPGYNINFSLGIGYRANFNCGTTNNPVIEFLDIPFQICEDSFFGGIYYDGLYIQGQYNRESFTTDPFDLCIPPSTTTYIKDNSGGRCTQEILYKDSYTGESTGLIGKNGIPSNDFGTIVPQPLMAGSCQYSFDPSLPDSLYCDYLRFSNKILVSEV